MSLTGDYLLLDHLVDILVQSGRPDGSVELRDKLIRLSEIDQRLLNAIAQFRHDEPYIYRTDAEAERYVFHHRDYEHLLVERKSLTDDIDLLKLQCLPFSPDDGKISDKMEDRVPKLTSLLHPDLQPKFVALTNDRRRILLEHPQAWTKLVRCCERLLRYQPNYPPSFKDIVRFNEYTTKCLK